MILHTIIDLLKRIVVALPDYGGGGGEGGMKLLHETAPLTEQVSAITVNFTEDMQGYDFYKIVLLGTFTGSYYPYAEINSDTGNLYLNPLAIFSSRWECFIDKINNTYIALISSRSTNHDTLQYFHTHAYNANSYYNEGFVVQIWGCMNENS